MKFKLCSTPVFQSLMMILWITPPSVTYADIVGGTMVRQVTDPVSLSTVALVSQRSGGGYAICSGTLISPHIALTAGHCVEGGSRKLRVVFGHSLEEQNNEVRQVVSLARPGEYAIGTRKQSTSDKDLYDIALVEFEGEIPDNFQAAELATDALELKKGQKLTLAGYGITGPKETHHDAGTLRKVRALIEDPEYGKTEILIDQTDGKGACHGDSGGPAYIKVRGKLYVVGVTSRGLNREPDDCLHHSVYTSVAAHRAWIEKTASQLERKFR